MVWCYSVCSNKLQSEFVLSMLVLHRSKPSIGISEEQIASLCTYVQGSPGTLATTAFSLECCIIILSMCHFHCQRLRVRGTCIYPLRLCSVITPGPKLLAFMCVSSSVCFLYSCICGCYYVAGGQQRCQQPQSLDIKWCQFFFSLQQNGTATVSL